MNNSDIGALERLIIVQACSELICRFAERNDARDVDALADMFVENGVFIRPTKPDEPYRGREAIREGFRARPASIVTRHFVSNTVVTPVSAAEATAVGYILLFTAQSPTDGSLPKADAKQLVGSFHDTLVRENGTWKFKERRGSLALSVGG